MKRLIIGILIGATFSVLGASDRQATATLERPNAQTLESPCGTATAQVRTTLYFGTTRPKGTVSELEWQMFLRDEVASRFPDGLTVWEAEGQWRAPDGVIGHERSKVLLLVHADTTAARGSVQSVIDRYRKAFEQQSVLWETARVCAAV